LLYQGKIWQWELNIFSADIGLAKLLELIYHEAIIKFEKKDKDDNIGLSFLPNTMLAFG